MMVDWISIDMKHLHWSSVDHSIFFVLTMNDENLINVKIMIAFDKSISNYYKIHTILRLAKINWEC